MIRQFPSKHSDRANNQHHTAQTVADVKFPKFKGRKTKLGRFILQMVKQRAKQRRQRQRKASSSVTPSDKTNAPDNDHARFGALHEYLTDVPATNSDMARSGLVPQKQIKLGGATPVSTSPVTKDKLEGSQDAPIDKKKTTPDDSEAENERKRRFQRGNQQQTLEHLLITKAVLEQLLREQTKKRRVAKLPIDLSGKHGEFPQPLTDETTLQHRMENCRAMLKYLREINNFATREQAERIVRFVKQIHRDKMIEQGLLEATGGEAIIVDEGCAAPNLEGDLIKQKLEQRYGKDWRHVMMSLAYKRAREREQQTESLASDLLGYSVSSFLKSADAPIGLTRIASKASRTAFTPRNAKKRLRTIAKPTSTAQQQQDRVRSLAQDAPSQPIFRRPASGRLRYPTQSDQIKAWHNKWRV
jgi:hypothetical protein